MRVHSLGSIDTPETILELRDANGILVSTQTVPPVRAPLDLVPRWTEIVIAVPEGTDISHGSLVIDPEKKIPQITRMNNTVKW